MAVSIRITGMKMGAIILFILGVLLGKISFDFHKPDF